MMKIIFKIYVLISFCTELQVEALREHYVSAKISNENLENIPTIFNNSIEILEIVKSNIQSLENLSTYKQLKHLVIKDSDIIMFNETFSEITKLRLLEHLSLEGSSIEYINIDKLGPNLKHLDLSNNPGIEICGSGFWSKISRLNIAYNKLTHIPDGLKRLRHLEEIVFDGNQLPDNTDYLKIWPKLKNINMDQKVAVEQDSQKEKIVIEINSLALFVVLLIIILITIIIIFIKFCKRKTSVVVKIRKYPQESEPFQIISLK